MGIQSDEQKQSTGDRTSHAPIFASDPSVTHQTMHSDTPGGAQGQAGQAMDSLIRLVAGKQPTAGVRLVGLLCTFQPNHSTA